MSTKPLLFVGLFLLPYLLPAQNCPHLIFCADWDDNDQLELAFAHHNHLQYPIQQITLDLEGLPATTYPGTQITIEDPSVYSIRNILDLPSDPPCLLSGNVSIDFENGSSLSCDFTDGRWDDFYEYDCPQSITYDCNLGILRTTFAPNFHNAGRNNIHVYFDLNGPNGNYSIDPLQAEPLPNVFQYPLQVPCADVPPGPDLTITYHNGLQCVYDDGQLCDTCEPGGDESANDPSCVDWLRSCRREVVKLINEEVTLTGCTQWRGDCGYDGPIYRMGKVAIGANISHVPNPYQLAVQDGILTQRTKIAPCSDWCDYVFEADYPLLPLRVQYLRRR
ncbi:MAG: hypothetical protein AAFW73_25920 [Bacteroidota bacterium]